MAASTCEVDQVSRELAGTRRDRVVDRVLAASQSLHPHVPILRISKGPQDGAPRTRGEASPP
jgi:hypothetical protein